VHSRASHAVAAVEVARWWALQTHVSEPLRKKGRVDGAESVRLTAHIARGRSGFRCSSPRVFQTRLYMGFRLGTPRAFQLRPLGLGWARRWGSCVEIAWPALSKDRANEERMAGAAWPSTLRPRTLRPSTHDAPVVNAGDVTLRSTFRKSLSWRPAYQ
jgi:hypothetical protein